MKNILANMPETQIRRKVKSRYVNALFNADQEDKFTGKSVPQQPGPFCVH